ncbi:MAG: glutamine synthetase family protein [Sedimentitalea sp.]
MSETERKIQDGAVAAMGLYGPGVISAAAKLVDRVEAEKLETIRVLFADQHGILRGKTIVASALSSVFASGLNAPSTLLLKDTSHRTVFPVWSDDPGSPGLGGAGDILMVPDPDTFRTLPWSPHSAWIFCDIYQKDGSDFGFAPRQILRGAIDRLAEQGMTLQVGLEVEFHVFERIDSALEHAQASMPGQPVQTRNLAQGYQFLTGARYGELESVMDLLRRYCQSLGLPIRSMEVEMGPSQFEFTFDPSDPMTHADATMMLRAMIKEVCHNSGLHATFMCRPRLENTAASGWHMHQSVCDKATGRNLMTSENEALSAVASAWIAGLLTHARASCLLTTPTVNGYKRYRPHQLAPDRIQWGWDNRGAMLRALMWPEDPASRVENRVADPAANPYFFFASQILAGLDGIQKGLRAPDAVSAAYAGNGEQLPTTLGEAIDAFAASPFYTDQLGAGFVDYLVTLKQAEWSRYLATVSEWEQAEYFGLF